VGEYIARSWVGVGVPAGGSTEMDGDREVVGVGTVIWLERVSSSGMGEASRTFSSAFSFGVSSTTFSLDWSGAVVVASLSVATSCSSRFSGAFATAASPVEA